MIETNLLEFQIIGEYITHNGFCIGRNTATTEIITVYQQSTSGTAHDEKSGVTDF
jgi:hypothetical protein